MAPDLVSMLWPQARNFLNATNRELRQGLGSNNWVVSGGAHRDGETVAGE